MAMPLIFYCSFITLSGENSIHYGSLPHPSLSRKICVGLSQLYSLPSPWRQIDM